MYICLCKAISEKDIERACKTYKSHQEIVKKLGLSTECGACAREAFDKVNSCLHQHQKVSKKNTRK